MRKVSEVTGKALVNCKPPTMGNTYVDGTTMFLFNNPIARWRYGDLQICPIHRYRADQVQASATTKERLNAVANIVGSSYRVVNVKKSTHLYNWREDKYTPVEPDAWYWLSGPCAGQKADDRRDGFGE